jgi:Trk K+ transport system NAD-binding subunit
MLRGDAADEEVLKRAGGRDAKLVIASMRRVEDALAVIAWLPGVPVIVRVFENSEVDQVRAAGGIPVSNAEASAEVFLKWLEANGRLKQALA